LRESVRRSTNEQGQYRILDLRPATYTVTFTLPGFNTFKREAIELPANFTAPVNAELQVGGLERRLPSPDIGSYAQFLSDPRRVRFHSCTRIPFWWIPGNRNMSGLTLANRVYLRVEHCPIDPSNRATVELVLHELAHMLHFRRNPFLFRFRYLLHHLRY